MVIETTAAGPGSVARAEAKVKLAQLELKRTRIRFAFPVTLEPRRREVLNLVIYGDADRLLLKDGAVGLVLVLLVLGTLLNARLAFWVMMGIPISFLGAMLVVPSLGVTINMMTLFAFILALGIVVDDAIVVGENVFAHRELGKP